VLVYSGFVTKVSSPVTTLTGGPMTITKMDVIIHQKKKEISFYKKSGKIAFLIRKKFQRIFFLWGFEK
jgi:hypothetical protein